MIHVIKILSKASFEPVFCVGLALMAVMVWYWKVLDRRLKAVVTLLAAALAWRILYHVVSSRYGAILTVLFAVLIAASPLLLKALPEKWRRSGRLIWLWAVIGISCSGIAVSLVAHSKREQIHPICRAIQVQLSPADFPAIYDLAREKGRFEFVLKPLMPKIRFLRIDHPRQAQRDLLKETDISLVIGKREDEAEKLFEDLKRQEPTVRIEQVGQYPWGRRKKIILWKVDTTASPVWGKPAAAEPPQRGRAKVLVYDFRPTGAAAENGNVPLLKLHDSSCRKMKECRFFQQKDGLHFEIPADGNLGFSAPSLPDASAERGRIFLTCRKGTRFTIQQYVIDPKDQRIISSHTVGAFRSPDNGSRWYEWRFVPAEKGERFFYILNFSEGDGTLRRLEIIGGDPVK